VIAVPHYKGLIACGRRLRSQWQAESRRFFPDADARILDSDRLPDQLSQLFDGAANARRPMIAFCSYDTVRRQERELARYVWDDLVVDEATILTNPSSQRSQALWRLRDTSRRGVALTGTPVERNLDDLAAILAWVRGDRAMFRAAKLTDRFDPTLSDGPSGMRAMWQALGPTVFRRDRSEIEDELPAVQTDTVLLDPEPAELALAQAAETQLRDLLAALEEQVAHLAEADRTDPRAKEIRARLRDLRSRATFGITLARMAACDPLAVALSESMGAKLLRSRGLVDAALAAGPSKRQQITDLTVELVDNGEAVLIFTDFAQIAQRVAGDLRAAGVRAAAITGQVTDRQADAAQNGFQGGPGGMVGPDVSLDALVLTKAAKEGLNLQRASVLIHLDLPWTATELVQRLGRASRIGAAHRTLQVVIPVMADTIEEKAARMIVARAATSLAALDLPRGVRPERTDTAVAVAGMAQAVSDDPDDVAQTGLLDFARRVLAA